MTVYAPADGSLVLIAGDREGSLRERLLRAVGALGLLGAVSLLVAGATDRLTAAVGGAGDSGADAGIESATGQAAGAAGALDPALVAGVACFVGGLAVLVSVALLRYRAGQG
jgi:hypothetical protein